MAFRYVDRFAVLVHTAAPPDTETWDEWCRTIQGFRAEAQGVLVFTMGGGPDSKQRESMRLSLGDIPCPPVAILTNASMIVRNIITSLNWFFGQSLAAYAQHDLEGALRHLASKGHVPPRDVLLQTLGSLAKELGIPLPWRPQSM